MRNAYQILVEKLEEKRDRMEDIGVNGKRILKWILKENLLENCGLDLSGSKWGPFLGSCCEHCNEVSCPIKGEKFLDQLSHCQFLKNVSAA